MAIRRQLWHPDKVRKRIQVSQLVNRLRKHALGECDMSPTQVKAAEILLRKSLPDLSSVEHSGEIAAPLSRDQIIERIAQIHADATGADDRRSAGGADEPPAGPATTH
jgi:hypothetical protein